MFDDSDVIAMTSFVKRFIAFAICIFVANGFPQCEINPLRVNPSAEARFAFVISLRQRSGAGECSRVSQSALQAIAAVEWAVNKVNDAGILTGMSLGWYKYVKSVHVNTNTFSIAIKQIHQMIRRQPF